MLCTRFFITALLRYNLHYHAIHPFKVCNSVVFNVFTELRNHCRLIWERFPSLCPLVLTFPPTLSLQRPLIYFSFSMDLPLLDISCKCSYTVCGLLWWLLSFTVMFSRCVPCGSVTQCSSFQVQPYLLHWVFPSVIGSGLFSLFGSYE